ncbi:Kef-type K+ transport system membrane component KefB [Paenarthrobacter nicotinovorans]|uniref:cation:proton antiporter n=1 Tax=Micrococcaceae TaxID=1268 RepID=UPI000877422B|nr:MULTISPECIES: cation:proton antiporter [Micrococcaceae]MDR6436496.1 Kef-type K+ transport system membrane component KefB [Paenarthrobacter nicotinovorans]SCZ57548.1 transporter, CPA2 family [Arthrobacter sp. UNCCL28]
MQDLPGSLVLIAALAVAAPIAVRLLDPVVKVPIVVFEIVLGILLGPSLLGWIDSTAFTDTLADFGLAMLFFVAGNEIDFTAIRGRPIRRASAGWLISLAAGIGAGFVLAPAPESAVIIGVALCSTALGTLLPIIRDAGESTSPTGTAVAALGAVGEFGPLIAISLFFTGKQVGTASVVLLGFVLLTCVAIFFASRAQHTVLHAQITRTLHTSSQFAMRSIMLVLSSLVVLSMVLGLDMLLGAFAAGVLWQVTIARAPEEDRKVIETKIDAVAFGFLVPVFFIDTGIDFDLGALTSSPGTLVLVPLFLVLLLVIRGLPSLLAAPRGSTKADKRALILFGATGLPIIVAVTTIGREHGFITSGFSSALVGAGMLSVLLFPLLALRELQRKGATSTPAVGPEDKGPAPTRQTHDGDLPPSAASGQLP